MRVLVHLNSLELGGTQINAVQFAAALRQHDIESVLVADRGTMPPGPSLVDIADDLGIEIEMYSPASSMYGHARQLSALARDHRADIVHVYGSWGGGARPTYWGPALLGRRPWIQTVYEMEVSHLIQTHMPIVIGTGYLEDELRDRPGRSMLISPPVDLEADSPDFDGGSAFRRRYGVVETTLLVIVSRLDRNLKSLPVGIAIDAMRHPAMHGATLLVVGTGEEAEVLTQRANRVNEQVGRAAVQLVGPMSDPRPAYAAADVLLGMGGSAARSLAFGKTLVVQGEAGWSELFEPSSAERLARSSYWSPSPVQRPVDHLVEILAPVVADAVLRESLGSFGRSFAADRFGLDAMTSRLATLYRDAHSDYSARSWLADLPHEGRMLGRKVVRVGRSLAPRVRDHVRLRSTP